jgi:hypothetical protein
VNPPGDSDADAQDFDQVPLVVFSFVFLADLVGGSLLFYLWRRSRKSGALSHRDRNPSRHQE